MSIAQQNVPGLGLRTALRLHPTAYRRERGPELAGVYADITAEAGRWAAVRELSDLAGHGLRLRLRLDSGRTLAQLAALVATFAACAAASGDLVFFLVRLYRIHQYHEPFSGLWPIGRYSRLLLAYWIDQATLLVSVAAAVAAVLGRWTLTRLLAPLGPLTALASVIAQLPYNPGWTDGEWVHMTGLTLVDQAPRTLWVLLLLAAPRDLLGPATRTRHWTALAGLFVGGGLLTAALDTSPIPSIAFNVISPYLAVAVGGAELALIAVSPTALARGYRWPAAAALAGCPIAFLALLRMLRHPWPDGLALLVLIAALAVPLARRRATPKLPGDGSTA
ncbi:hypothetical protein CFP65_0886 [Kitasatospora sp. MMS16-BH015]|uniref:hypothetical protein n=1 Tax=Kitasatospora sp. MMS16-BH015 TaxID=2018025 RepID=UPI000CA16178|nr:hypothetical protein [Kitasatospora sp. MMS16-BH015]AUG75810.1 hypothetical protein CFP65_0886 [Kitasatospora sp. MMS16-BH015]